MFTAHAKYHIHGMHFDEVAEHVVVTYAQVLDFRRFTIFALQSRNQAAAFIAQGARFIERACKKFS